MTAMSRASGPLGGGLQNTDYRGGTFLPVTYPPDIPLLRLRPRPGGQVTGGPPIGPTRGGPGGFEGPPLPPHPPYEAGT